MNRNKLLWVSLQNFGAQILPAVAALVSIPVLIQRLGTDKFGAISLGLAVVGYFNILDFGLGRALVREVSIRLGNKDFVSIANLFWGASLLLLLIGLFASAATCIASPVLIHGMKKVPAQMQAEGIWFFRILSINLPMILVQSSISAVLMGYQDFKGMNIIRTIYGTLSFAGLIPLAFVTSDLAWFAISITVMRFVSFLGLMFACYKVAPYLSVPRVLRLRLVAPLLKEGGWMWIITLLAYLFMYSDRFLIGAISGLTSVTIYTTSMDALSKISLIHGAVTVALFPSLARMLITDPKKGELLAYDVAVSILIIVSPILLCASWAAPEWLTLWLGEDIAKQAILISRVICVGLVFNCIANIPFNQLQAAGKSKQVAIAQVFEFFPYMGLLWVLVQKYGVVGAAIAWSIRLSADYFILLAMASKTETANSKESFIRKMPLRLMACTCTVAIFVSLPLPHSLYLRAVGALISCISIGAIFWIFLMGQEFRNQIISRVKTFRFQR